MIVNKVFSLTEQLLKDVRRSSYTGYDPFDGLNSPFIDWSTLLKKSILGLAWIQFFKRSPVNFRPLFAVPKKRNPKGIGLFILGLLNDYKRTGEKLYLTEAVELGDWLLQQQCDQAEWQHSCWGYHFDWKAKAFYVPKGKPNVITTIYVAQALLELSKVDASFSRFKNAAFDSANFIYSTLLTKDADNKPFIAYIPGEKAFVHNASLWGAAWLAIVGKETNNGEFKSVALEVAKRSADEQQADGSWVYGAMPHHQFIDGFHTGYNLEALDKIRNATGSTELDSSISKGLHYYESTFFTEDGTAKYYDKNAYPLDMHSVSQAIITLLEIEPTEERKQLVDKIIKRSFETLYDKKSGKFAYQRTQSILNRINYTRWTQAWVYYSFSTYLLNRVEDQL